MDTVVLVKVVPDLDELRVDPATGLARRQGVGLFVNPFDQRALRVALDLRLPTESVTVLSMGPPSAEGALHETRGLGADRAVLLTDPALAGSDTLITARVLSSALARLGGDLVLAGNWSTDSETGQVPPELAELLGRPFVPAARRIARTEEGVLEVDSDVEDGWTAQRLRLPAVVSVGEKITKIRKLLPEEVRASSELPVEKWSIETLGLSADEVGLTASPTFVGRLLNEAPPRRAQRFEDGAVPDRVRAAVDAVRERLTLPASEGARLSEERSGSVGAGRFLVLASGPTGDPVPSAVDIADAASAPSLGWSVEPVWVGTPPAPQLLRRWGGLGARAAWLAAVAERPVPPEAVVDALQVAAAGGPIPDGVAMSSDLFGRSVAGRLAARNGWGLTGDAVGIAREGTGRPLYRKPAFGGRWVAEIGTRSGPGLVTVRPGALPKAPVREAAAPELRAVALTPRDIRVTTTGGGRERDDAWGDLHSAPLVLVVGQGVGGPESVLAIRDVARSIGAALGATRRVVDLGWAPRQLQVGLTGLSLEPRLAVLLGVGGSPNHLVGLHRASVILAVNRDPSARVFAGVDVGIVGDWQEVLPILAPLLPATVPRPGALR